MNNDKPKFYNLRRIAREENVPINTAYNWIKSKKVRTRRRDGRWYVAEKDFRAAAAKLRKRHSRKPMREIIIFLQEHTDGYIPTVAIARSVGISHEHAAGLLTRLYKAGKVTRVGRGVRSDPYCYALVLEDDNAAA